jgi:hypothetical protein
MSTKKLDATLHKEPDGTFSLYFCRGEGKCTRTEYERQKMSRQKRKCPDCVKGNDNETLGELAERLERGDS